MDMSKEMRLDGTELEILLLALAKLPPVNPARAAVTVERLRTKLLVALNAPDLELDGGEIPRPQPEESVKQYVERVGRPGRAL